MNDGLLFFYFFWIFWIIITFFMPKSRKRTVFAVFILLSLCFANIYINVSIQVSFTYLILLFGVILLQTKQPGILYHFICTFTISIGYAALLLWESNTTIWLFTSREILIPSTIVCISHFITYGFYNRLICALFGLCIGELIFKSILYFFSFKQTIGDMEFLDIVSVTIMVNVFIALCVFINNRIRTSITQMTYK